MPIRIFATTIASLLLSAFCSFAIAVDVATDVSTRETYVNVPITLQVQINNAVEYEQPIIPPVDGLEIESLGVPSRSYSITTINGRRTQRTTMAYQYSVTPTREGTFTIPPVKIIADGRTMMTKATRIVATKSETEDLLFVEIEGNKSDIYVGEALDLKLKIWIKPYRDEEFKVTLNEPTMWSLIGQQTKWGPFTEALETMAQNRQRPGGEMTLKADSEGTERGYLLFEIEATVYPDRPGEISGDDVRIIVNYPVELGRSRSPLSMLGGDFFGGSSPFDDDMFSSFGSRLAITRTRPIVAETSVASIRVNSIPQQGRPDTYRGAVGEYRIITQAGPTSVKVGDPITLNIGIDGTGPMDVIRAPPLANQASLTRDFKVPNEPLAGFVEGTQKVFTTSIRPIREGVTEIPPIEFTYFDPDSEQFVTALSEPISITVEPAELLALDSIVGRRNASSQGSASSNPLESGPVVPIFQTDREVLQDRPRPSLMSSQLWLLLLTPPVLVILLSLYASRHHVTGLISAKRRFRRAIAAAATPEEIGLAVEQFLMKRFRLPSGRMLRDQTVGQLRAIDHPELAVRTERIYAKCFRSGDTQELADLRTEAKSIVETLLLSRSGPTKQNIAGAFPSSSATFFLGAVLCVASASSAIARESERDTDGLAANSNDFKVSVAEPTPLTLKLTRPQLEQILQEAADNYQLGVDASEEAEAKERFAAAVEKLETLVDSGTRNDALYSDLAAAQFGAGDLAGSIANYRRALRYAPANQTYWEGLSLAESLLNPKGDQRPPPAVGFRSGPLATLAPLNDLLLHFVSPVLLRNIAVVAWFLAWAMIAWRILASPDHWKLLTSFLFAIALLCAASYGLRVRQFSVDNTAVVTRPEVVLRSGDGLEFPPIAELTETEGMLVRILDRREGWRKIELPTGAIGWMSASDSEEI